jgi:hypothetical protein
MREEDDQLYIYKLYGISVPRKVKVSNISRRIPNAKITQAQIENAQELINNPRVDFEPYAIQYIRQIEDAIYIVADDNYMREDDYEKVILPLTEIKGQAGMFGNNIASELSAHVLKFIERYKRLDKDVLQIIALYCKSIRKSYSSKLFDIEQTAGHVLLTEIQYAMQRYDKKFKAMTGR